MAIQTINIGNVVNDGLGDDLRTAFQKVNANFTELDSTLSITGENVGTTGTGIFKQKDGTNLQFKNLVSGTKVLIEDFDDTIKINNTAPDAFVRIDTNSGNVIAGTDGRLTIQGSADIDVVASGSIITINTVLPFSTILTNYDFGNLNGQFNNSVQFNTSFSNVDFGTITYPGRLDLDLGSFI